jgi:hypothetical protein
MKQTSRPSHLRPVPASTAPAAQPEIPVRFNATGGLAVPERRPYNSFRWVGHGSLRIEEAGLVVTAQRLTLLGHRTVRRFIPAGEIRDVYREGNAIQVHLRGARDPYFRLWAEDAAAATQIVARLPTKRTIELETPLHEPVTAAAWHLSPAWVAGSLVVAAAVLGGYLLDRARVAPTPTRASPTAQATAPTPVPAQRAVSPSLPATHAPDSALTQAELHKYLRRMGNLSAEFGMAFDTLRMGGLSQEAFIEGIDRWLLPQWDTLATELGRDQSNPQALSREPSQAVADAEIAAVISYWQLALKSYRDDLRAGRTVVKAFDYMRLADAHREHAEALLERLERQDMASRSAAAPLR